jgi:putative peptidoglycan lipid II flippase
VFGIALGTVILPKLSSHYVKTDREGFSRALDWGLRTALLIAVPAMLGLVILAKPMVATLFQHGRFTAHDVDMAGLSLAALSLGLPAFALVKVVAPAFYARQDTRTPVRAGVAAMVANMVMNLIFVGALSCGVSPAISPAAGSPGLRVYPGCTRALPWLAPWRAT